MEPTIVEFSLYQFHIVQNALTGIVQISLCFITSHHTTPTPQSLHCKISYMKWSGNFQNNTFD